MSSTTEAPEKKRQAAVLAAALGVNAAAWFVYLVGEFLLFVEKTPYVFFFSSVFLLLSLGCIVLVTSLGIAVIHVALRRANIAQWLRCLCYALPGMMVLSAIAFNTYTGNIPAGLITAAGTYPSPSRKWELVIARAGETLIHYEIKQADAPRSYMPKSDFSDVHRWFFYWENDRRLWCHSSDIGTSVWVRDDNATWSQEWLPSRQRIPQAVADYLPKKPK